MSRRLARRWRRSRRSHSPRRRSRSRRHNHCPIRMSGTSQRQRLVLLAAVLLGIWTSHRPELMPRWMWALSTIGRNDRSECALRFERFVYVLSVNKVERLPGLSWIVLCLSVCTSNYP